MTPPSVSMTSMDKIEVIQRSLRCFTMGLIGLLPALGIPFAAIALSNYFRVKRIAGAQWNPAQQYLTWGLVTALCGLFLTVVLVFVVGIIIAQQLV